MSGVGGVEGDLPAGGDFFDSAVEYLCWCEERKSRMVMIVIVPSEELLTPGSTVRGRGEAIG